MEGDVGKVRKGGRGYRVRGWAGGNGGGGQWGGFMERNKVLKVVECSDAQHQSIPKHAAIGPERSDIIHRSSHSVVMHHSSHRLLTLRPTYFCLT